MKQTIFILKKGLYQNQDYLDEKNNQGWIRDKKIRPVVLNPSKTRLKANPDQDKQKNQDTHKHLVRQAKTTRTKPNLKTHHTDRL